MVEGAPDTPRGTVAFGVALAALAGTLPLAGMRPAELALLVALGGFVALRIRSRRDARPLDLPAWVDPVVVTILTLGFLVAGAGLANPDQPVGTDWFDYLGNAAAVGDGAWDRYHDWRGPLHAWACLALLPLSGGLIAASQHVALLTATALLPLTWWLGRLLLGRWPALLAVGLLAGWADLRLFAVYSTPYALLAATGTLGLALTVASRARPVLAVPAGIALGAAIATDQRGLVFVAAVAVAAGLDALRPLPSAAPRPLDALGSPAPLRRRLAPVFVATALAFAIGGGALAALPVTLRPLSEQVALQRELHAREGAEQCAGEPSLAQVFGPCGRATLSNNLGASGDVFPVELATLVVLLVVGLAASPGARAWLLLPILPTLPSLVLVGAQHRYFVPLAPLFALLAGAGLAWAASAAGRAPRGTVGRGPGLLALVVVVGLGVAWHTAPGTLWTRAHTGKGIDPGSLLEGPSVYGRVRAALAPRLGPRDTVVDCARAGMGLRVYPHRVEDAPPVAGELSRDCAVLVRTGSRARGVKWVIAVVGPYEVLAPSWEVVWRGEESPGREAVLLRSTGAGR